MHGGCFPTSAAGARPGSPWRVPCSTNPMAACGLYGRLWERTVDEMRQLLERARNRIRAGALADDRAVLADLGCSGYLKGAGTVPAGAAAHLAARHAAQPAQAVRRAVLEQGADTDTLATVTVGLLGCLAADGWLPAPWREVPGRNVEQQADEAQENRRGAGTASPRGSQMAGTNGARRGNRHACRNPVTYALTRKTL